MAMKNMWYADQLLIIFMHGLSDEISDWAVSSLICGTERNSSHYMLKI